MDGSKTKAWFGAIAVHAALVAGLIFSVRWKQVEHLPVAVELVTPIQVPDVQPLAPAPPEPTPPLPVAKPLPTVTEKAPRPPVPTPSAADIARESVKLDDERRQADADKAAKAKIQEKARQDALKKEADQELAKKQAAQRAADLKVTQDKALKEQQAAAAAQAAADKAAREAAERAETARVAKAAEAAIARARAKAEGEYVAKIRSKVLGNIILASEVAGNPEAIFSVTQMPTGEILDIRPLRSSGNKAYDDAVERAIRKSSPLPKPDQAELFQRQLTLKFRPQD